MRLFLFLGMLLTQEVLADEAKVSVVDSKRSESEISRRRLRREAPTTRTETVFYQNLLKLTKAGDPSQEELKQILEDQTHNTREVDSSTKLEQNKKKKTPAEELQLALACLDDQNDHRKIEDTLANIRYLLISSPHKAQAVVNKKMVSALIALLNSNRVTSSIQTQTLDCLDSFCSSWASGDNLIEEEGGLNIFLSFLKKKEKPKLVESAIRALSSLVGDNSNRLRSLYKAGAFPILIETFNNPRPGVVPTLESYVSSLAEAQQFVMLSNGFYSLLEQEVPPLAIREGRLRPEIQIRFAAASLLEKLIKSQGECRKTLPVNRFLPMLVVSINLWSGEIGPHLRLIEFCLKIAKCNKKEFIRIRGVTSLWVQLRMNPYGMSYQESILGILWRLYEDSEVTPEQKLGILLRILNWASHFSMKKDMIECIEKAKSFAQDNPKQKKLVEKVKLSDQIEAILIGVIKGGETVVSRTFLKIGDGLSDDGRKLKRKCRDFLKYMGVLDKRKKEEAEKKKKEAEAKAKVKAKEKKKVK